MRNHKAMVLGFVLLIGCTICGLKAYLLNERLSELIASDTIDHPIDMGADLDLVGQRNHWVIYSAVPGFVGISLVLYSLQRKSVKQPPAMP